MGINLDKQTFEESIEMLFDERTNNCSYYQSRKYDEIHDKVKELDLKLKKKLGKKKYRQLWDIRYGLEDIYGQELGEVERSAYRRGFADALFLSGEIRRAEQGLPTLFSGKERFN